jgi:group II intron reverse transcriptase/maturase
MESETSMSLKNAESQMAREQLELPLLVSGEAHTPERSGEALSSAHVTARSGIDDGTQALMRRVVERKNLLAALKRVQQNKGSPGIDGMRVAELPKYLTANWERIREALLAGTYQPAPVRRHEIPKAGGGMRMLGIPTVCDRFIQQAILQVVQPIFDPTFSDHSYGFRPGRSAHHALLRAQQYIESGRCIVVDVDLEKFFDRVNHDILMGKLRQRINDTAMLTIIRRYLRAGIMANGVVMARHEGTPQGGPLSPLLANVLLDDVDKELERRGHAFVRYADDCNVYVQSTRAGERLMRSMTRMYAKLRLCVNTTKSAVAHVKHRQFLGYGFIQTRTGTCRFRLAEKSLNAFKDRVRELTNRRRGRSLPQMVAELAPYLRGWKEYFRLVGSGSTLRDLNGWIHRRLRMVQLYHWRRPGCIYQELRARGIDHRSAYFTAQTGGRWWRTARNAKVNMALPKRYWEALGVPTLG